MIFPYQNELGNEALRQKKTKTKNKNNVKCHLPIILKLFTDHNHIQILTLPLNSGLYWQKGQDHFFLHHLVFEQA